MGKLEDWIDYLEGSLDLGKMEKLSMLLRHSINDQVIHDNLRRLRQNIKETDPAREIQSQTNNPEFMERLHNRIMSGVAEMDNANEQSSSPILVAFQGLNSAQVTYNKR
jgi:hypothetical protein